MPHPLRQLASLRTRSAGGAARARERLWQSPFQFAATVMAIPIGVTSLILGAQVSTAMSRVMGGQVDVVRFWGAFLVVGGALAVYGRYGDRPAMERMGLRLLGIQYFLYSLSVLVGLGIGGLVTGPMFAALTAACFTRSRLSFRGQMQRQAAVEMLRGTEDRPPRP
jgi:hypothetical protein